MPHFSFRQWNGGSGGGSAPFPTGSQDVLPPSSQRALPLVCRADLQIQEIDVRGRRHYVVKDPLGLTYLRLLPVQHRVLNLLDGTRSLDDVVAVLHSDPEYRRFDVGQIRGILFELHDKGLVWSSRPGTAAAVVEQQKKERVQRWKRRLTSLLFIRLPGWNARTFLVLLTDCFGWLFTPWAFGLAALFGLWTGLFLLSHFEEFQRQLPSLDETLTGQNLMTLWCVVGGLKILHEFGHGIACRRFGGESQTIGMAFLVFSPCLYCDVSDSWMLSRRGHRMVVSAAGMYVELLIASVALWLWWFSVSGLFHSLCLQIVVVGSVSTLLFNANPLLRYDGYYLLQDLFGVPNLQSRSQQAMQDALWWTLLGAEMPDNPLMTPRSRIGYVAYGLGSAGYRWSMVLGVGLFLYSVLEPYGLQVLAWGYALASVVAAAGLFLNSGWKAVQTQDLRRSAPIRLLAVGSVVGGLGWFVLSCPMPFHVTAPLIVEARGVQHVYSESPGRLQSLLVREGERVEAGQPIAGLVNPEFDHRIIELEGKIRTLETDSELARAISDPDLNALAREGLRTVSYQLEHARSDRQRLSVRAPVGGRILTAPPEAGSSGGQDTSVPGLPVGALNSQRLESHVLRRTHLCSIVPEQGWQAVVWVDQEQLGTIAADGSVDLRLEAFPGRTIRGTVESIAAADESTVPAALSKKSGGQITTQSAEDDEVPDRRLYRVVVRLEGEALPLLVGMRGTCQLDNPANTVGEWLYRAFYRTFPAGGAS